MISKYPARLILLVLFYPITIIINSGYSQERISLEKFLQGKEQLETERIIAEDLNLVRSENITKDLEIYDTYLITSSDTNIIVYDMFNHKFYKLDNRLQKLGSFGRSGRGPGEFIHPIDITSNSNEQFWIVDSRLNRISIYSSDGQHIEDLSTPFGVIPEDVEILDNGNFAVFSLMGGSHQFYVIDKDGDVKHRFLSIESTTINQKGFILDGTITSKMDTIYYTGIRNNVIKAFTPEGKTLYSRQTIEPHGLDLLSMDDDELRHADRAVTDMAVDGDHILIIYSGLHLDHLDGGFIDVYHRKNGEYVASYVFEDSPMHLTVQKQNDKKMWVIHSKIGESSDVILSVYESPL